ncbi:hypothetical protein J4G37_55040, partial [Microvirga sp. 3-52]|nr:hypothetical protein [Microvirga sp. 3-52]
AVQIIQSAVYGRLIDSSLSPEQLPTLLPHLRKYGWPGESVSTIPVRVAFRLTEPEEDSDSAEWMLETVVVGERERHWTPAVRKRNLPVAEALPDRWAEYAEEIAEKQSEMISFLRSV